MNSDYIQYDDQQLSAMVVQNDTDAFEELYQRHWFKLYLYAFNRTGNKEEAEDVVQDTFVKLLRKLPVIHAETSVIPYLYEAVRNTIVDLFRRSKHHEAAMASFAEYYSKGVFETDEQVRYNELVKILQEEVDSLPPQMRKIYEMSRQKFMSNIEIAQELNIGEDAVKKTLYRAMQRIRKHIGRTFWFNLMLFILWLNRTF